MNLLSLFGAAVRNSESRMSHIRWKSWYLNCSCMFRRHNSTGTCSPVCLAFYLGITRSHACTPRDTLPLSNMNSARCFRSSLEGVVKSSQMKGHADIRHWNIQKRSTGHVLKERFTQKLTKKNKNVLWTWLYISMRVRGSRLNFVLTLDWGSMFMFLLCCTWSWGLIMIKKQILYNNLEQHFSGILL